MVRYDRWGMPMPMKVAKKERPKRLVSVSKELHELIKGLALDQKQSMKQVVSSAVLGHVKTSMGYYEVNTQTKNVGL